MIDISHETVSSNSRSADIMISLSVGLLAGAAVALLLTHTSGNGIRRRIGEFAEEVADQVGQVAHRATNALRDQAGQAQHVVAGRLENAIHEGKQAYRQGLEHRPG